VYTVVTAEGHGGIIYTENIKQLNINVGTTASSFTIFSSDQLGSFLYSIATTLDLDIQDTTLQCRATAFTDVSAALNGQVQTMGGAFYIVGSTNTVTSTANTFKNCYTG